MNSNTAQSDETLKAVPLCDLPLRRPARIVAIKGDAHLETTLREMGFAEEDEVEIMGLGPLGGSPLSVRLNRMLVALRRGEAGALLARLL